MIACRTLTDGGQSVTEIAGEIAAFVDATTTSLDHALYDFDLDPEIEQVVAGAISRAHARGVAVRLAYNVDFPNPIPVPPPPSCVPEDVAALPVQSRAILGIPDLMHHKFAVRDRQTVLTGSTNWTSDSWTRQENVMLTVESPALAEAYSIGFEQLWSGQPVMDVGHVEPRPVEDGAVQIRPWFCPGYGDALSHRVERRSAVPGGACASAPR